MKGSTYLKQSKWVLNYDVSFEVWQSYQNSVFHERSSITAFYMLWYRHQQLVNPVAPMITIKRWTSTPYHLLRSVQFNWAIVRLCLIYKGISLVSYFLGKSGARAESSILDNFLIFITFSFDDTWMKQNWRYNDANSTEWLPWVLLRLI